MKIILPPEELKDGLLGTEQLVEHIGRLIREGGKRPEVKQFARRIMNLARPQDVTAEQKAVWDYLTRIGAPPYRMDPIDVQLLVQPEDFDTLDGIDCKKFAIVAGAVFEAAGMPVKVRVIDQRAQDMTGDAQYHHVYLRVFNKDTGRWVTFDPVVKSWRQPGATVGTELAHKARRTYMVHRVAPPNGGRSSGGPQPVGFSLYESFIKPFDFTRDDNKNNPLAVAAKAFLPDTVTAEIQASADAKKPANVLKPPAPTAPAEPPPVLKPTSTSTLRIDKSVLLNTGTKTNSVAKAAAAAKAAKKGPVVQTTVERLTTAAPSSGMSTGAKVGIAAAGVAVVGGIIYALTRKKKRRTNPRRGKKHSKRNKKRAA